MRFLGPLLGLALGSGLAWLREWLQARRFEAGMDAQQVEGGEDDG